MTSRLEQILAAKLPPYLCKIGGHPPTTYAATRIFVTKDEFDVLQSGLCNPGASHSSNLYDRSHFL